MWYNSQNAYCICYYCKEEQIIVSHKDNCSVVIGWVPIEEIQNIIIYPEFLKKEIYDLDGAIKHFVSK